MGDGGIPDETPTMATYWFIKWVDALDKSDFIMANVARDHLNRLGFEVKRVDPRRRARSKGAF